MYTYRNKKTGVEFVSVTECKGDDIEIVKADEPKQEAEKKPARGKKK